MTENKDFRHRHSRWLLQGSRINLSPPRPSEKKARPSKSRAFQIAYLNAHKERGYRMKSKSLTFSCRNFFAIENYPDDKANHQYIQPKHKDNNCTECPI